MDGWHVSVNVLIVRRPHTHIHMDSQTEPSSSRFMDGRHIRAHELGLGSISLSLSLCVCAVNSTRMFVMHEFLAVHAYQWTDSAVT